MSASLTLQVVKERFWLFSPASSFLLGGDNRDRTGNLRLAKPALSQLSYIPEEAVSENLVGLDRFELSTSRLSGVRSHQLSYRPGNLLTRFRKIPETQTVACEGRLARFADLGVSCAGPPGTQARRSIRHTPNTP